MNLLVSTPLSAPPPRSPALGIGCDFSPSLTNVRATCSLQDLRARAGRSSDPDSWALQASVVPFSGFAARGFPGQGESRIYQFGGAWGRGRLPCLRR